MLYCHIHVHAEIYKYMLDTYRRNDNRRRKSSLTKYLPLTLLQGFEKGYSRFACERELEIEHNCNILTSTLMAVNVVSFLFFWCSTGALGPTLLGAGFLYCILSASSLDSYSSGIPEGPLGRVWLSLPQLVYNSVWSSTQLARQTQLSYILVRRPLDLWNRMFNRHQAEITVMQRSLSSSASLCSGTVGPSPCPILSALIRPRDLFRLLAIGMCHFLPVHHLGIAFLDRVEGQNTTRAPYIPSNTVISKRIIRIR